MKFRIIYSVLAFFLLFNLCFAETILTECTRIEDSGTYILNDTVESSSTCFTIDSDDFTLDCKGHKIIGGYNSIYIIKNNAYLIS